MIMNYLVVVLDLMWPVKEVPIPLSGMHIYFFVCGNDNYRKVTKVRVKTIFMKGFDRSLEEDQIRSSLEEHFGSWERLLESPFSRIMKLELPKGLHTDFKDQESFNKAHELNGSDLGGYPFTVDEASRELIIVMVAGVVAWTVEVEAARDLGEETVADVVEWVTVAEDMTLAAGPWSWGCSGAPFRQQSAGQQRKNTTFGDD